MQQWVEFEVKIILNMFAAKKNQDRIYVNFVLRDKIVNFSKYFADKILSHLLMIINNQT